MVYVGFFGGSRPCLAEVSDWLAVAVKNELSKAIRAIPILEDLSGAATFDDGTQLTLEWHGFRLPTLGVFRLKVNHTIANVRPAQRRNRTFTPTSEKSEAGKVLEIFRQMRHYRLKVCCLEKSLAFIPNFGQSRDEWSR